jgi:type IV pilus assembly protein PilB
VAEVDEKAPDAAPGRAPKPPEQVEFTDVWRPADNAVARGPEQILLQRGAINTDHLERAAKRQRENPRLSLLEALVQSGAIDDLTGQQALAEYFKLPFQRVTAADVDASQTEALPQAYLKSKLVLPLRRSEQGVVVAIANPADIFLIDDLRRRLRHNVSLVVALRADILRAIEDIAGGPTQQVDDIIKDIAEDAVEVVQKHSEEVTDLEKIAGESPVIRYVNYLVTSAVREGASDIHVEPGENRLRVRLRIDGVLFEQQAPPLSMHAAIISRLKIMANMNIAERRLPQDGRIRASVHGRAIDLRVSMLPVVNGEKCVIRILDNRSILVGLDNLGMLSETLERFRNQVNQPHGVVLVTGPTGSGKSTTLYSALCVMDSTELNISTVEDPVEYELDFINQVNVHESIGMTFAAALRSLLRQDPDVVMIGEIRDVETARIAVQASLTGHLVLSTLHTNDAPSSVTRLINIGIEPYLISAAMNAVLAQRLVRRICPNCKEPVANPTKGELAYLQKCGGAIPTVYRGKGCDKCRNTGYKGRLGIYELLELDDDLRDIITSSPSLTDLRRASREHGMQTLRDDGLQKVAAGLTTVEEIMKATET